MTNNQIRTSLLIFNQFVHECGGINTPAQHIIKKRVVGSFQKWIDETTSLEDDIRVKHCLKGENGKILRERIVVKNAKGEEVTKDGDNYDFDEVGRSALKLALKEFRKKESEIEILKVDWDLFSDSEKSFFNKIVDDESIDSCKVFIDNFGKAIDNDEKNNTPGI